jgi:Na+/proline symporter
MANWFPGGSTLTWPDYAILGFSLALLVAIGLALVREQRDTVDFFLARRRVPWWAACLSFLATEISAVTIISVPATAYSENLEYFQFFIGSSLAKFAVALLFIPAFYRYDCTTIYEFLGHRFGRATQVTGSVFFFITRLMGSGVRLMAAALAVSILIGWQIVPTIVLFTVVSILYIAAGGVKAVVWTNVFQALTFLVGGAATLVFLIWQIDGGLGAIVAVAGEAGRLNLINWGPSPGDPDFWRRVLTDPNIVWLAILNGLVGSMAAFGTDHDLMQRLLTVETRGESQRTLSLTPLHGWPTPTGSGP